MIIIDKTSKKAQIVDFAVPADHRIKISQQRKTENYQILKRELQKLWNLKTSIVPPLFDRTLNTSIQYSLMAASFKEANFL